MWNRDGSPRANFFGQPPRSPARIAWQEAHFRGAMRIEELAVAPAGGVIATRNDAEIRLWTADGVALAAAAGPEPRAWFETMTFIDDAHLAAADTDGLIRVWDMAGREVASAVAIGVRQ